MHRLPVMIKVVDGLVEIEPAFVGQVIMMTREEILAKARDLVAPVLGAEKCSALLQKIFDLESVSDIRALRPLLQLS